MASFSHVLVRCSQVNLDESKLPIALKNEVGDYLALPLIPFQSRNVQGIIIRDAHRRAHHMGSDYTFAKIYDEFYLFGTVEFHQTTSCSQFDNGVCERLHKIGCDILRTKLHLSKLTVNPSWTEIQIQDLLDLACCALNLRPVGWYVETSNEVKYPITPHVLVFGNC